jgi:hypothetical protein
MPKPELTPPSPERQLTAKDRRELVAYVAQHTRWQSRDLVFAANWHELSPYMELVGMMGILMKNPELDPDKQLAPGQLSLLRKMVAVQSTMVPRNRPGLATEEFFKEVDAMVSQEVELLQNLPDEKPIPKDWKQAYDDILRLQKAVEE